MSAEQYGARLLAEVQEETLEEFLAELRRTVRPQQKPLLGVPQLDDLLETLCYPAQTPRRSGWDSPTGQSLVSDDEMDEDNNPDNPEITPHGNSTRLRDHKLLTKSATIELSSHTSAAGKSQLLSYLTAVSTLPTHVNGKSAAVVYIDSDARFSASRLSQILLHYLNTRPREADKGDPPTTTTTMTSLDDAQMKDLTREALDHVHVYRPRSSSQVLSILDSLPAYLLGSASSRTGHSSSHRPLGLIILDSATAFYWQDRFDHEMARLDAPPTATIDRHHQSMAAKIIERLKALQRRFECIVVLSTTSPTSSSSRLIEPQPRQPTTPSAPESKLVSPWRAYATLTLNLSRVAVPQFAPRMGMEECLRDREKRMEVAMKGQFVATASVDGGSGSGGRERTGVTQREGGNGCVFRIGKGVEID